MPPAARALGTDTVFSKTGTGKKCPAPLTTATAEGSGDTFFNSIPAVRQGDMVAPHPAGGCGLDASVITTHSSKVFVNGRGVARIGDQYTGDNIITSGSGDIFCG